MLTTEEVARRLGVKPATVYAYVSRGLLTSERNADGKGSLFGESEVEAFAAGRRHSAAPGESPPIHTGITLIKNGGLYYRGHDATALARTTSYEAVATLLWTADPRWVAAAPAADRSLTPRKPPPARATPRNQDGAAGRDRDGVAGRGGDGVAGLEPDGWTEGLRFRVSGALLRLAEAVTAPLPGTARLADRLRVIVAAAAAADPLRFDVAPAAVVATGRTMLATMVAALPLRRPTDYPIDERFPLAGLLWPRLTAADLTPAGVAALNAALVLLADHDIAASTLAARVAASTRAHPYAVVGAGLAVLDGPLHGAASGLAYAVLQDALLTDPLTAISAGLRTGGVNPGFGHRLYPDGDPRARALLALLHDQPTDRSALATIDAVAAAVTQRSGVEPNIDFAVAAFTLLNGMSADAGEAIFAIARTAGWIAHALEEYGDRPSRFRPTGHYAGQHPTT